MSIDIEARPPSLAELETDTREKRAGINAAREVVAFIIDHVSYPDGENAVIFSTPADREAMLVAGQDFHTAAQLAKTDVMSTVGFSRDTFDRIHGEISAMCRAIE